MTPNEILADLLAAHDIEVIPSTSGALDLPAIAMRASAELFPFPDASPSVKGQVDMRLELWPGRTIIESAAAIGESDESAQRRAFEVLSINVLHVWLAAFMRPDTSDDRVERERWVIGGRERDVIHGNVAVTGSVPFEALRALMDTLVESLEHLDVGEGVHWIRVFAAQQGDRRAVMETLLDNEPWPELQRAMERLPVVPTDGYASVRLFLVVESERMEVGRAANLIATFGADLDDTGVVEMLVAHDVVRGHAEQLMCFVIAAFGHVVVESLGVHVPSRAFARLDDGSLLEFELGEQPVYAAARAYAAEVFSNGPRHLIVALAGRSSDLRAVEDALAAGHQASELRGSGNVFFRLSGLFGATHRN